MIINNGYVVVFKHCSVGSKGPKLWQESIPHIITPPITGRTVDTRQDGSKLTKPGDFCQSFFNSFTSTQFRAASVQNSFSYIFQLLFHTSVEQPRKRLLQKQAFEHL